MESRARSAGFSVMEIGNRKKRLAFLYEFPGLKSLRQVWAAARRSPKRSSSCVFADCPLGQLFRACGRDQRTLLNGCLFDTSSFGCKLNQVKREIQEPQVLGGVWGKAPSVILSVTPCLRCAIPSCQFSKRFRHESSMPLKLQSIPYSLPKSAAPMMPASAPKRAS